MKHELEQRIIRYAVSVLDIVDMLPESKGAQHLGSQLVRSGTAPALMYGEARAAESRKDFIHKMKLALKELRETMNALTIVYHKKYLSTNEIIEKTISENDELIAIFVKSIHTARNNEVSLKDNN